MNYTLVDLLGGYWKHGLKSTKIMGLFRRFDGNEVIMEATLEGLTPANNRAYIQGKLRAALCRPEAFEWQVSAGYPVNPGLLVRQDIIDISLRVLGWPIENRRSPELVVEHHLLDEVAAGIESESRE
jgi:hypothetical protein